MLQTNEPFAAKANISVDGLHPSRTMATSLATHPMTGDYTGRTQLTGRWTKLRLRASAGPNSEPHFGYHYLETRSRSDWLRPTLLYSCNFRMIPSPSYQMITGEVRRLPQAATTKNTLTSYYCCMKVTTKIHSPK